MSNGSNTPFGLVPVAHSNGADWNGEMQSLPLFSGLNQTIFKGDLIVACGGAVLPFTATQAYQTLAANIPTLLNATGLNYGSIRTLQTAANTPTYNAFADFTVASAPQVIGVFQGCKYVSGYNNQTQVVESPIWMAGTRTVDDSPAEALVITDPSVVYKIQTSTSDYKATDLLGVSQFAFGNNFPIGLGVVGRAKTNGAVIPTLNVFDVNGAPLTANPTTGDFKTGRSAMYVDLSDGTVAANGSDDRNNGSLGIGVASKYAPLKWFEMSGEVNPNGMLATLTNDLARNYATIGKPGINANLNPNQVASPSAFNVILVTLNKYAIPAATLNA